MFWYSFSSFFRRNRGGKVLNPCIYVNYVYMKVMYKRNRFFHSRMEAFSGFLRLPWDVLCFEKPGPTEFLGSRPKIGIPDTKSLKYLGLGLGNHSKDQF